MMADQDEHSDYWLRRFGVIARKFRNGALRGAGIDWWEDEDGKKHFYRPSPAPAAPSPPPPTPAPPPTDNLIYSEPDLVSRNDANHPATRRPLTSIFVNAEGHWGDYIKAILHLANPGISPSRFDSWFRNLFNGARAFDNDHAYGSGNWAIANLFCAGWTGRLVGDAVVQRGRYGYHYMQVRAIDPRVRLPIPRSLAEVDMTLHFFATTATATGNNPFPQFEGRAIIPFFAGESDGTNWVNIDGEPDRPGKMVRVNRIQHPFIPMRADITKLGV